VKVIQVEEDEMGGACSTHGRYNANRRAFVNGNIQSQDYMRYFIISIVFILIKRPRPTMLV
jgi:hypothetical protein